MPDGRPVIEGLVITKEEAYDALQFFVRNVVEPLVRKHFVCRTQHEFDACVSFVYNINHSRLERGDYSLPSLINLKARDPEAITNKWLQYVATPGFENGLYRRRIAECLMFMGLSWNAPAVWGYISTAIYKRGGVKQPTDPWFIIDVAQALEETPKTEDQITADLNNAQLEKLGGKVGQTVATPRPPPPAKPKAAAPVEKAEPKPVVIETPKLQPAAPAKPMEQSKTHRGLSKKESGQETVIIGTTVTGIGALLPNINALTAYLEKFPVKTILLTVAIIGVAILIVGAWRWWAGRMIAWEGRQEAEQPKV
jgi:GH24 family phage-related lysozyme (muramidase)